MFGFLPGPAVCCQKAASVYRAHFCGLGSSLHRQHGAWARCLVNRDSTFIALLGSALSDAPPALCRTTCCNRFAPPRDLVADNAVLQYTSAVTVCALDAKLDDDTQDERGWRRWTAKSASRLLDTPVSDALGLLHAMRFPVAPVRAWMAAQNHIEQVSASLQECALPTSAAYAEITAHLADVADAPKAKPALRQLGANLGLLVYAQDAWDDWAKDRRRGQFNPLHAFPDLPGRREALLPSLRQALAAIRDAFEALPLRRNRDLLHSMLIEGVEQRVAHLAAEEKEPEKRSNHSRPPVEKEKPKRDSCWDRYDKGEGCCDCNPCDCCDCLRVCRPGRGRGPSSCCDCNPCDGDGCECCGCDCS